MAAPGGVLALPAPAPPPPVVVTVGAPLAARCLAFIPTNDPIVQRTRFLPWTDHAAVGGAAATSSIPAYVLLRHFIVRCTIGGLPADLAAAQLRSVLTGSLTGAAWGRILTEFVASGLLNLQFTKRRELLVAVKAVQINNPGNLTCNENGGAGWSATVVSFCGSTAVVNFTTAATAAGQRYEDERLPLSSLRKV